MKLLAFSFGIIVACFGLHAGAAAPFDLIDRYVPGIPANIQLPDDAPEVATVPLEKTDWRGLAFSSSLTVTAGKVQYVSIWTEDTQISPAKAQETFDALGRQLEQKLGRASTIEVPNFGDASEVKNLTKAWRDDTRVLILSSNIYSSRGDVSLFSSSFDSWVNNLGADASEYFRLHPPAVVASLAVTEGGESSSNTEGGRPHSELRNMEQRSSNSGRNAATKNETNDTGTATNENSGGQPWLWLLLALPILAGIWFVLRGKRAR